VAISEHRGWFDGIFSRGLDFMGAFGIIGVFGSDLEWNEIEFCSL